MDERPDLIVVGDVMVDVAVAAGALATGGDVHGDVRIRPGGSAANAAAWAVSTGARVRIYGRVGDDLPGRLLTEALRERGVDARLTVDPHAATGAMLVVHQGGERSLVASRGANARLSPADLPEILEARAVLLSGYVLYHPGSEPAALAVVSRSRADLLAVDPASWPLLEEYGVDRFFAVTERAQVLLANEREAMALTGVAAEESARTLSRRYTMACVKLGARGALLGRAGTVSHADVDAVDHDDPTGAGDAFNGVFLSSLAGGADPDGALRLACEAGARVAGGEQGWPG